MLCSEDEAAVDDDEGALSSSSMSDIESYTNPSRRRAHSRTRASSKLSLHSLTNGQRHQRRRLRHRLTCSTSTCTAESARSPSSSPPHALEPARRSGLMMVPEARVYSSDGGSEEENNPTDAVGVGVGVRKADAEADADAEAKENRRPAVRVAAATARAEASSRQRKHANMDERAKLHAILAQLRQQRAARQQEREMAQATAAHDTHLAPEPSDENTQKLSTVANPRSQNNSTDGTSHSTGAPSAGGLLFGSRALFSSGGAVFGTLSTATQSQSAAAVVARPPAISKSRLEPLSRLRPSPGAESLKTHASLMPTATATATVAAVVAPVAAVASAAALVVAPHPPPSASFKNIRRTPRIQSQSPHPIAAGAVAATAPLHVVQSPVMQSPLEPIIPVAAKTGRLILSPIHHTPEEDLHPIQMPMPMRESSRAHLQSVKPLNPLSVQPPISKSRTIANTPPVHLEEPAEQSNATPPPSKLLGAGVRQLSMEPNTSSLKTLLESNTQFIASALRRGQRTLEPLGVTRLSSTLPSQKTTANATVGESRTGGSNRATGAGVGAAGEERAEVAAAAITFPPPRLKSAARRLPPLPLVAMAEQMRTARKSAARSGRAPRGALRASHPRCFHCGKRTGPATGFVCRYACLVDTKHRSLSARELATHMPFSSPIVLVRAHNRSFVHNLWTCSQMWEQLLRDASLRRGARVSVRLQSRGPPRDRALQPDRDCTEAAQNMNMKTNMNTNTIRWLRTVRSDWREPVLSTACPASLQPFRAVTSST